MIDPNQPLDSRSAEVREVYAYFGLVMYSAQCLERELSLVLTVAFKPRPRTRPDFDELLERRYRKTLGALVAELRKAEKGDAELEGDLVAALEKRNWLAHHYFWDRAGKFMTSNGRYSMMEELKLINDEFSALDKRLSQVTTRWRKKVGITDEIIDAEMRKLAETQ